MNSYVRVGSIGWGGALLVSYFAYTLPANTESYVLFIGIGIVFGLLAYAVRPVETVHEGDDVNAEARKARETQRPDATLDELKVSADTAKELVKSRGEGDIDLSMPGITLRLGKPKGKTEEAPDTDSGTWEAN